MKTTEDKTALDTPAPAMGELVEACAWVLLASKTLAGYSRDLGVELPDDTEIGRIYESRDTPSFRISVGHIRRLAAALAKIGGAA